MLRDTERKNEQECEEGSLAACEQRYCRERTILFLTFCFCSCFLFLFSVPPEPYCVHVFSVPFPCKVGHRFRMLQTHDPSGSNVWSGRVTSTRPASPISRHWQPSRECCRGFTARPMKLSSRRDGSSRCSATRASSGDRARCSSPAGRSGARSCAGRRWWSRCHRSGGRCAEGCGGPRARSDASTIHRFLELITMPTR